jgi:hypothetical protein
LLLTNVAARLGLAAGLAGLTWAAVFWAIGA